MVLIVGVTEEGGREWGRERWGRDGEREREGEESTVTVMYFTRSVASDSQEVTFLLMGGGGGVSSE